MAVTSPYSGMTFQDILRMRQQAGQPVMPFMGQPAATTASMEQQAPNFNRFLRSVTPETEVPSSVGVTGNVVREPGTPGSNNAPDVPSGGFSQTREPAAKQPQQTVQQQGGKPSLGNAAGTAVSAYGSKKLIDAALGGSEAAVATPEVLEMAKITTDAAGRELITPASSAAAEGGLSSALSGPGIYAGGPNLAGAALGGAMAIGGAYGFHNQFGSGMQGSTLNQGAQGALNGAMLGGGIGSFVPGVGTAIGAGVGAVVGGMVGLARGAFGNRKNEFELMQDSLVDGGLKIGLFSYIDGEGSQIPLADGSLFKIEDDGGYMIDENREFGVQGIGWTNGLAAALTGGHGPKGEKESPLIMLTGYLTNAATSNVETIEGVRANALSFVEKAGYTRETLEARLTQLRDSKGITEDEYNSYMYGVKTLFEGDPKTYNNATVAEFKAAKDEIVNQATQVAAQVKPPATIDPNSQIAQTVSKAPQGGTPEQGVIQGTPQINPNITPVPRMAAQVSRAGGTWIPPTGSVIQPAQIRPGMTALPVADLGSTWTPPVTAGAAIRPALASIGASPTSSGVPAGFRPGSRAAGGVVDNATNKWYATPEEALRARG